MLHAFTDHPAAVGETYFEHQRVALAFSLRLIGAGLACGVHAFAPWLFVATGSRTVCELHDRMADRRTAGAGERPVRGPQSLAA